MNSISFQICIFADGLDEIRPSRYLHYQGNSPVPEYVCSKCGKSFLWKSHLAIHERVHSGLKPFKCVVCEKSFAQKGNLKAHMVIHENWPEAFQMCCLWKILHSEREFKGSHGDPWKLNRSLSNVCCEKSFTQKGNLKAHMEIHGNWTEAFQMCAVKNPSLRKGI